MENRSYIIFDDTKKFIQKTYDLATKLDPTRLMDHESGMPMVALKLSRFMGLQVRIGEVSLRP